MPGVRFILAAVLVPAALLGAGPPPVPPPDAPAPAPAPAVAFVPPTPSAATERVEERIGMVDRQIVNVRGRPPVQDEAVLRAMRAVPRHVFVPEDVRDMAYADFPLSIGHGQTISQPYIVALMTQLLDVDADSKVLEIGTGSGYQAAVLAHLTPHVHSIEIVEPLAKRAAATLRAQGYDSVKTRCADGYGGWAEAGPFDAIIVTCSTGHLPPPLWEQLAPGGVIVVPIGSQYMVQRLVLMTKLPDGSRRSRTVSAVRFVPMTGQAQKVDF